MPKWTIAHEEWPKSRASMGGKAGRYRRDPYFCDIILKVHIFKCIKDYDLQESFLNIVVVVVVIYFIVLQLVSV